MSEVVSIPQLRFPEFRDEWRVDKFVDLCKFQQGVQVDVELQSTEPKNNFLRFLRIENYTQKSNDFRYIPKELSSNKSITENEIAIVRYGATAGYIGRGLKGILANNLFKLVLNKDTLDTDYLFHLLRSYKTFCFFQSEMSGGAMPALSFGIVGALKLPYSSISEQQKIAAFLTAVDTKIEQLSKKQELLGEYKKGLMQQIFSQAIRFRAGDTPGQPLLPNGNSPSGSDFPNWEEKRLGDLCEITTGKLDANAMVEGGQYRFYTCAKEYYKIDDYAFDTDALIVSGNGANVGYIHHYQGKFNAYQRTYVLDSFTDNIIFVKFVLDEYLHKRIMKEKNEGNTPYIVMGTLTDMKINLPSFSEQTKIAIFLSSIDSKIEQVGKQLDESKQFKKALLQQMFV